MTPRSRIRFLILPVLLCACSALAAQAETLDPGVRNAVVCVEVAVDPASAGPALMRDLAARPHPTKYERELLRRLRMGAIGTGFFVNRAGYVVTNAHVILSGVRYRDLHFSQSEWNSLRRLLLTIRDVWVRVGEGPDARDYLAEPVAIAEDLDLAVLRVLPPAGQTPSFSFLPLASASQVRIGDAITSLGFPSDAFQMSRGKVLSLIHGYQVNEEMQIARQVDPTTGEAAVTVSGTTDGPLIKLQHDAQTGHGSSGGPLLDAKGRVVAVAYAMLSERDPDGTTTLRTDLNLGIVSDVLAQLLTQNGVAFTEGKP